MKVKIKYVYWTKIGEPSSPGQYSLDEQDEHLIISYKPLRMKLRPLKSLILKDLKSVGIRPMQIQVKQVVTPRGMIFDI